MYKLCLILIISLLSSCSSYNLATRGEHIDDNSIKKGTPRVDLLARFGRPVDAKTNSDGSKVDLFRVPQGETTTGKIVKGTGTAALAVVTLGISEIVAAPVTEKMPYIIFEVTYNQDERVEDVKFIENQ